MDKLQVFQSGLFESVRAMLVDNEPWFVGSDVAKSLDYNDPSTAVRDHVDEEDIMISREYSQTNSKMLFINESGVYALIFGSEQERAKQFKRWVTHEVLPALRRTGQYSVGQDRVVLSEEKASELAQILSHVEPVSLPYVLAALKMAGYRIEPEYTALLDNGARSIEEATGDLLKVKITSRKYPFDLELVEMLHRFSKEHMRWVELSRRSFVGVPTLMQIRRCEANTNPEFAARIKNAIREMYAERDRKALEAQERAALLEAKRAKAPEPVRREPWQRRPNIKKSYNRFRKTEDEVALALRRAYDADISMNEVSKRCGICRSSLYKYMWAEQRLHSDERRQNVIEAVDSLIAIAAGDNNDEV